ncbi:hypothetical protein HNQ94_000483 [Salirhabdus euzebyi]|uniref:NERD domain-containing protein n=1 Tax=Salirhabdus euzebyi TaxID=394506 RepID=A0A841Q1N2_9BACI|nr:nuclease-related domain-containing protein [Salirhabdus euzebyi]MBB6452062.1 hypothetical protein [Salirhabdus euzebyi]
MIKKELKESSRIRKLKALERRLPQNHEKLHLVQKELAKSIAGYHGEKSLDYFFRFLTKDRYFIFHDIRLPYEDSFFQLDVVLVSPYLIIICEVKNIAGTLYFDGDFHQLIRKQNGEEQVFSDPLLQVKRQHFQLAKFLQTYDFSSVPIENLVIISNRNSIIKSSQPQSYSSYVIPVDYFPFKISELESSYEKECLSIEQTKKLSSLLLKNHTDKKVNILEEFQLTKKEIRKGTQCPNCLFIPILKNHGGWLCPNCNQLSKNAHLPSLMDYSLLIKNTISNSELCDFLKLPSRFIARSLLNKMDLSYTGSTKGRKYKLP